MSTKLKIGNQLQGRWDALAARERRLLLLAASLVGGALLWWLAIGPALATLRLAQVQHSQLDAQLQQMQMLKAQAAALQSQPKLSPEDARRALDAVLKQTPPGTAQMVVLGDRASVTLKAMPADALAQWLMQARVNARSLPVEVRLVKSAAAPASQPGRVAWDGTVVLKMPAL